MLHFAKFQQLKNEGKIEINTLDLLQIPTALLLLFSLALQPSAGYGLLVHEVS
jgi:hypothetical protein